MEKSRITFHNKANLESLLNKDPKVTSLSLHVQEMPQFDSNLLDQQARIIRDLSKLLQPKPGLLATNQHTQFKAERPSFFPMTGNILIEPQNFSSTLEQINYMKMTLEATVKNYRQFLLQEKLRQLKEVIDRRILVPVASLMERKNPPISYISAFSLVAPNETGDLFSSGRQCFWPDCHLYSTLHSSLKTHLDEAHDLTAQSIAQLEICAINLDTMIKKVSTEAQRVQQMIEHLTRCSKLQVSRKNSNASSTASSSCTLLNELSPRSSAQFTFPQTSTPKDIIQEILKQSEALPMKGRLGEEDVNNSEACLRTMTMLRCAGSTPEQATFATLLLNALGLLNAPSLVIEETSKQQSPQEAASFTPQQIPTQPVVLDTDKEVSSRQVETFDQPHQQIWSEKTNLSLIPEDCSLSQRQYYRTNCIRPRFTYSSLIRQAISESANKCLSLSEIYAWLQSEFTYFRQNEATWKNAIRHNLSLHKCFRRRETAGGSVWVFDEQECTSRKDKNCVWRNSGSKIRGLRRNNGRIFGRDKLSSFHFRRPNQRSQVGSAHAFKNMPNSDSKFQPVAVATDQVPLIGSTQNGLSHTHEASSKYEDDTLNF